MPVIPPIEWSEIAATCSTGDVILFTGTDTGSQLIEDALGGPYSHVVMLVRPDPNAAPLMWQEATESPAPDPIGDPHNKDPHAPHPGAQAADAKTVLKIMTDEAMLPFYRRLEWDRTPEFEAAVHQALVDLDGVPFGTYLTMVADYEEGRWLNRASGGAHLFCAQLVALTLQRAGLLGPEHPPNWYSPDSFSAQSDEVQLLQGAHYVMEQPIALPLS